VQFRVWEPAGFQHMVIEYMRNALGMRNAENEEYSPDAINPLISRVDCSLAGRELEIHLDPSSFVASGHSHKFFHLLP
jgi:CTP synthase (UTP-ammonia lyase)